MLGTEQNGQGHSEMGQGKHKRFSSTRAPSSSRTTVVVPTFQEFRAHLGSLVSYHRNRKVDFQKALD